MAGNSSFQNKLADVHKFNPVPYVNDNKRQSSEYSVDQFNEWDNFDLYKGDPFINGYSYIFITKPDLNIYNTSGLSKEDAKTVANNLQENSFIRMMSQNNHVIIRNLNGAGGYSFMKILSNKAKAFSNTALSANMKTVGETLSGYKQNLSGSNIDSVAGGEFSIKYHETQHLDIIRLHKVWCDYIEHVRRGTMTPKKKYIDNFELDYTSSMYYFVTKPDGQSIIYWAKYTGLIPLGVPYDILSFDRGNINADSEVEIPYAYSYKEDMNLEIFHDFKEVMQKISGSNAVTISEKPLQMPVEAGGNGKFELGNESRFIINFDPRESWGQFSGSAYPNSVDMNSNHVQTKGSKTPKYYGVSENQVREGSIPK